VCVCVCECVRARVQAACVRSAECCVAKQGRAAAAIARAMPTADVQCAARRVFWSSTLAAACLVLSIAFAYQGNTSDLQNTSSRNAAPSLLSQQHFPPGRRDGPVMSSLMQMTMLPDDTNDVCDCSAPTKCTRTDEAETDDKLPGGGVTYSSGSIDFGAWDPVTGVPRIACTDTVTHSYCEKFPRKVCLRAS
jgi:hypothetical protein